MSKGWARERRRQRGCGRCRRRPRIPQRSEARCVMHSVHSAAPVLGLGAARERPDAVRVAPRRAAHRSEGSGRLGGQLDHRRKGRERRGTPWAPVQAFEGLVTRLHTRQACTNPAERRGERCAALRPGWRGGWPSAARAPPPTRQPVLVGDVAGVDREKNKGVRRERKSDIRHASGDKHERRCVSTARAWDVRLCNQPALLARPRADKHVCMAWGQIAKNSD